MKINDVIKVSRLTYEWLSFYLETDLISTAIKIAETGFPELFNGTLQYQVDAIQNELNKIAETLEFSSVSKLVAYLLSTNNFRCIDVDKNKYVDWLLDNKTPIKSIHFLYEAIYTPAGTKPGLSLADEIEIIEKYIKRLKGENNGN